MKNNKSLIANNDTGLLPAYFKKSNSQTIISTNRINGRWTNEDKATIIDFEKKTVTKVISL